MLQILAALLTVATLCEAHAGFRAMIPNGFNVPNPCANVSGLWNAVGHNLETGGGDSNVFGVAFKNANATWSKALCSMDSDSDGKTNGVELGDPECTWTAGATPAGPATGHPGVCEPMTLAKCQTINQKILCPPSPPRIILP